MWDETTYPFPNFNGVTIGVWDEITSNLNGATVEVWSIVIPHFIGDVITYPCWD